MNNTVGTCEAGLVFQTLLHPQEGTRASFGKMPQRARILLLLPPNPGLLRLDKASKVSSKEEPGGSCGNGPSQHEKETEQIGRLFVLSDAHGRG